MQTPSQVAQSGAATAAALGRIAIRDPDQLVREDRAAAAVAGVSGVIFVFAGLVKFVFHHWELHAFRSFGLPWPSAVEILAGVLEIAGGALLVLRRSVAPTAVLLAATMAVAIGASGIGHGDIIPSLTLAPALLLAMLFLLGRGLRAGGGGCRSERN
ncbi:MAG: DoxX family protein [Solirubrobacteraceae bacterium]